MPVLKGTGINTNYFSSQPQVSPVEKLLVQGGVILQPHPSSRSLSRSRFLSQSLSRSRFLSQSLSRFLSRLSSLQPQPQSDVTRDRAQSQSLSQLFMQPHLPWKLPQPPLQNKRKRIIQLHMLHSHFLHGLLYLIPHICRM